MPNIVAKIGKYRFLPKQIMPCAVILTALPVEYLAVRAHLTDPLEETHPQRTIYERGRFTADGQTWDVGLVEIGAGNPGAALEAERAIAYFSPDVILFVGVAGGIKDVALGDVVASTKVYGYESGKAEEIFRPRPEIGLSTYGLEQRARAEARKTDWLQRLSSVPSPAPRVFVAPIAAGEKVVASIESEVFKFLQSNCGDAIAVEMEGFGFLDAARANQQVSALVIRGISDLIYNKTEADKEGYQEIAARHASAFAFEMLAKFGNETADDLAELNAEESTTPYRGLEPFEEEQAEFFFGREQAVKSILQALDRSNFVAVIGSSGSGKSSTVRAGLVPELRKRGWQILEPLKPDFYPLHELAVLFKRHVPALDRDLLRQFIETDPDGLRKLSERLSGNQRFFLLVDQFEEVFTLCGEGDGKDACEIDQKRFIDLLTQVSTSPSRLAIAITLRADFLEPCLQYSNLTQLIQTQAVYMQPMLVGEALREAITQPCKLMKYGFEPGLDDEIIQDVGREAGWLPLLQFSLWKLWQGRDRNHRQLTLSEYHSMGRVTGALNRHADEVYKRFDESEQIWVKRICLELVQISRGMTDVRQRRLKRDLLNMAKNEDEQKQINKVISKLVEERLLVSDGNEEQSWIDLAHESLMDGWELFAQWRVESRDLLRLVTRIEYAYQDWNQHGKSSKFLLPEGLLIQTEAQGENLEPYLSDANLKDFYQRSFDHHRKSELTREQQLNDRARHVQTILQSSNPLKGLAETLQLTAQNLEYHPLSKNLLGLVQDTLHRGMEISRECHCFEKHEGMVECVAISPDGQFIASGSSDKTVRLWDLQGRLIGQPFRGHEESVWAVAFSPDSRFIVSGSADNTIRLWDLQGNLIAQPFRGHQDWVRSVTFSPDGKSIISGSKDHTLRLWDIQRGQAVHVFRGHQDWVLSVAASPNGQFIVSGSADTTIRMWDFNGNLLMPPLEGHEEWVRSVAVAPNGNFMVSGSNDGTLCLWDLRVQPIGKVFEGHRDKVLSVTVSPDSEFIVSSSADRTLKVWDVKGNLVGQPLQGHQDWVRSVKVSPDGKLIISGSRDKTIRLWDLQGNSIGQPLQGHQGRVLSVAVSPDGKLIASGGRDKTVRLWDLEANCLKATFEGHEDWVRSVKFTPDGKFIVSGGEDRTVRLWDVKTGKQIGQPLRGHDEWVRSVAVSPDGKLIISGSDDNTICLWDLNERRLEKRLEGHQDGVLSVAFSPDGKLIVSGSADAMIRLWDLDGKQIGQPLQGHQSRVLCVVFSPAGSFIASGSQDKTVRLWNFDGQPIGQPFQGHEDKVRSVAFSPDGEFIVSGSEDNTLRLWNLEGNPIGQPFQGHQGRVRSVKFSPNGEFIVSGSEDGTVRLWRGGNWEDWLRICCDRIRHHPYFTAAQTDEARAAYEMCRRYGWTDGNSE